MYINEIKLKKVPVSWWGRWEARRKELKGKAGQRLRWSVRRVMGLDGRGHAEGGEDG